MTKFTWNDLVVAISKMSVEQREQQVFVSIEDEGSFRRIECLDFVPEDVYVNKEITEDAGSLEDLQYANGDEFRIEDYELSTKKGTPFLWDGN